MFIFHYLNPIKFHCCQLICRIYLVPCVLKCPRAYWVDPPGYEGYYEPEFVEFNPPQTIYGEQEVPKEINPQPDKELEHGYEYNVTG